MLDLTSLVMLGSVFLGLVVGDAAIFGDRVQVQITVPSKVSETGFTEAAAEQVFAAHVAALGQAVSIVETPSVEESSATTVLGALAQPLHLDKLVAALQARTGIDVVTVHSVIVTGAAGGALDMVTIIRMPHEAPLEIKLSEDDGDANALVQRSAVSAMEYVSPYRLALTHFVRGLKGNPALLMRAKDIASMAVARPWVPSRATEQVMLHNLLAMIALLDGDEATANAQFSLIDQIPDASPQAQGVIDLNRCFLDIASRQPTEAERRYQAGKSKTEGVTLYGWSARVTLLGALVAWSRGDLPKAEAMLRTVITELPEEEAGHAYLAQLLEVKGDTMGAAAQRIAANETRRFDIEMLAEPQSLFWVDPVHGGLRRRS